MYEPESFKRHDERGGGLLDQQPTNEYNLVSTHARTGKDTCAEGLCSFLPNSSAFCLDQHPCAQTFTMLSNA
eukprot:3674104-Amphidinium_carterae.1